MADYNKILTRAIDGLAENSAENRRKVYEKARGALQRQLASLEGQVSAAELSQQRLTLEEAIREVEREQAGADLSAADALFSEPQEPETPAIEVPSVQDEVPEPEVVAEEPVEVATPEELEPEPAEVEERFEEEPTYVYDEEVAEEEPHTEAETDDVFASDDEVEDDSWAVEEPEEVAPAPEEPVSEQTSTLGGIAASATTDAVTSLGGTLPKIGDRILPDVSVDGEKKSSAPDISIGSIDAPSGNSDASLADVRAEPEFSKVSVEEADAIVDQFDQSPVGGVGKDDFTVETPDFVADRGDASNEFDFGEQEIGNDRTPVAADAIPVEQPKRRSFGWILVLLLLLGGGAFAYVQKDTLAPYLEQAQSAATGLIDQVSALSGSDEGAEEASAESDQPSVSLQEDTEQPSSDSGKNAERLLGDDSDDGSSPLLPGTPIETPQLSTEQPAGEVLRDVTSQATSQPSSDTPEATAVPTETVTPPPAEEAPAEQPQAAPADQSAAPVETAQPEEQQVAVVQPDEQPAAPAKPASAILYQEESRESGETTVTNGSVAWELVENGSAGIGADGKPSVRADANLEGRDLKVRFELMRNLDDTLPASHLIEMEFMPGGTFSEKSILEVNGVVVKASEQARGKPLIGAVAKVAPNLFWLALSDSAADQASNSDLLQEQFWIDIPVVFESGKRAILTLEKGKNGGDAMVAAFKDWTSG